MKLFNADEALRHAEDFVVIATKHADGDVSGTAELLEHYYGTEHDTAVHRLWLFAGLGPMLIAFGVRGVAGPLPPGVSGWSMRPTQPGDSVHHVAMYQAVTAYLNDDTAMVQDVITAHHAVHGVDGLYDLVMHAVIAAAELIRAGAIPALRKEN